MDINDMATELKILNEATVNPDNVESMFIDVLCESINNIDAPLPLSNNIFVIDTLIEYKPLTESIEEIKEFNDLINKVDDEEDIEKKTGLLSKVSGALNKMLKWYFKVDPNKQFYVFRVVVDVLVNVFKMITKFMLTGSYLKKLPDGMMVFNSKGKIKTHQIMYSKPVSKLANAIPKIPDNANSPAIKKAVKIANNFDVRANVIRIAIVMSLNLVIDPLLNNIRDKLYMKYNRDDLDKTIAHIEHSVDTFDEMLNEGYTDKATDAKMNAAVLKYRSALNQLYAIRDKIKDENLTSKERKDKAKAEKAIALGKSILGD